MNLKELQVNLAELAHYIDWNKEILKLYHRYAYMYNCSPGENVFKFVLLDALAYRGITYQRFVAKSLAYEGKDPL